jgi:hypothetical protein
MNNPAGTSARRMKRGVAYNFAVSFFYYYILGYAMNRAFRRPIIGMAPAFRYPHRDAGCALSDVTNLEPTIVTGGDDLAGDRSATV